MSAIDSLVVWVGGMVSGGVIALVTWFLRRPNDSARSRESYAKAAEVAWERLSVLESKVSMMEVEIAKRDAIIGRQQIEIDRLHQEIVILRARMGAA